MDNVSHTLIGLAVGEAALQLTVEEKDRPALRNRFWWVSALANNLPDIDVLFRDGGGGYLLEHRGYTHTVAGFLPQALLIWLGAWLVFRKHQGMKKPIVLLLLALGGVGTHVAFDALNSYGVHPWWPLTGRWYYGDTLFILEPWLWLTLTPLLFLSSRGFVGRAVFTSVSALALFLLWGLGYVPHSLAAFITVWAAVLFASHRALAPTPRAIAGVSALVLLLGVFGETSRLTRQAIREKQPGLDDVILTPMPANPLCWTAITVAHDDKTYTYRRGIFAPFPKLLAAKNCPAFRREGSLAPLNKSDLETDADPRFDWEGEFRGSLARLRELARQDCTFRLLLHFARAPYVLDDGRQTIVADLRYDFSRRPSFAAFRLPASRACPADVPAWGMPRADWLKE